MLCGEMLTLVKEPLYLRRRWEDIGGSPPPRAPLPSLKREMERQCGPPLKSEVKMPCLTAAMEVARSGQTSGPLRSPETWLPGEWKKKVECGPALESKVLEEPKVKSELPHLRGSWRRRRWNAGGLKSELPCVPKVLEERKVKKCRQWHCHVCGKHVSSSNRAKHMKRMHAGFYTGRRGRPKVLRGCVDLE